MKWVFATLILSAALLGVTSCGTNEETTEASVTDQNVDSLLSIYPDSVPFLLQRGEFRFANYQFDLAMQDAAKAYRLEKNNPKAKLLFAEVLNNRAGRTPEDVANAQALYDKILKKDTKNLRAMVGMASTHTYQQNFEKSFEYLNKALRIDDHYRDAYVLKGTNYMTMGKKEQAISSYETAVQQDPEFYEAYFFLANIYESDGNRQCIEYYRNALELRSDSREIRYKLAYAQQQFDDELGALENYRILASDTMDFYANRGYFHQAFIHQFAYEDVDSAIYLYNQALKKEPRHVESWHNLGVCYDWIGNKTKALQSFGKALKYNPEFELSRDYADSIQLLPESVKVPSKSGGVAPNDNNGKSK
jgi:tetratricopeptide (TPR) repeat protein